MSMRRREPHERWRTGGRPAGGFSLVEILVALGVFALGMAGILALFGTAAMTAHEMFDTADVHLLLDEIAADIQADFPRYAPRGYPDNLYGYPDAWLRANGDTVPQQASRIVIPRGWPGTDELAILPEIEEASPARATFRHPITYAVHMTPLTNTADPRTGRPQCVLATITVYWTRSGRTHTYEATRVVLLPPPPPAATAATAPVPGPPPSPVAQQQQQQQQQQQPTTTRRR